MAYFVSYSKPNTQTGPFPAGSCGEFYYFLSQATLIKNSSVDYVKKAGSIVAPGQERKAIFILQYCKTKKCPKLVRAFPVISFI